MGYTSYTSIQIIKGGGVICEKHGISKRRKKECKKSCTIVSSTIAPDSLFEKTVDKTTALNI